MNRQVKSIFLLLIFSVLIVHGMIPHHHHERNISGETLYTQANEANCHLEDIVGSEHSECDFQNNNSVDSNHECPHHFHNCRADNIEFNYSKKSLSARHWKKSADNYAQNKNSFVTTKLVGKAYFFPDFVVPFNKYLGRGIISLRAPPVLG